MRKRVKRLMGLLLAVMLIVSTLPTAAVSAVNENGKTVIACVGDSLTFSFMSTNGKTYPNQLQSILGDDYKVHNFGVNGSTVSTKGDFNGNPSGYALQPEFEASLAVAPDIVLLTLGSNDAKRVNWTGAAAAEQYEKDYRALIAAYQALDSHPLVILGLSPTVPVEGTDHNAILTKNVQEINEIQRKVAAELKLPTMDVFSLLYEQYDLYEKDSEQSGGDDCHPNNSGYGEIARLASKAVRTYAAREDDASIVEFLLTGEEGGVNKAKGTVYVTVPFGAELNVEPSITLPQGATITPTGAQDFSKPVTYTVTARDGETKQEYTVYATPGKQVKVACVGDSITYGGYPFKLYTALGASYEVKNFGVNSLTVCKNGKKETGNGKGAYMEDAAYRKSLAYQPDVVFVLLGSNDSKVAGNNPDWVTNWTPENKAAFKDDFKELIESYRQLESAPTVFVVTPTKPYSNSWGVSDKNLKNDIIPMEQEVAEELGCPFIDLYTLFTGHRNDWLGGDALHPNDAGNEVIGQTLAAKLKPLKLDVVPVPASLELVEADNGSNTVIQGQEIDYVAAALGLTYSDGATTNLRATVDMLGEIDDTVIGTQKVTATYMDLTCDIPFRVRGIGDANDDGEVTTTDARLILQYAAELDPIACEELMDANCDGDITTADARLILQYAAEIVDRIYPPIQ